MTGGNRDAESAAGDGVGVGVVGGGVGVGESNSVCSMKNEIMEHHNFKEDNLFWKTISGIRLLKRSTNTDY